MASTTAKSFATLASVGVIAAVVFGVLTLVAPRDAEPPETDTQAGMDQVFGASVQPAPPEPVVPPPEPDLEHAPDVIDDEDAADPGGADTGATNSNGDDMDSLLADVRGGERASRQAEAATAPTEQEAEPAKRTEVVTEPEQTREATASAPAQRQAPAAAPETTAAPRPPATPRESPRTQAQSAPAPARDAPPPASAMVRWWPNEPTASGFGLRHAGQLSGDKAIALLFTGVVDAENVGKHVRVLDERGEAVRPSWTVSETNTRMAVLRGLNNGRYTVIVSSRLADVRGRAIGSNLQGPVYIH
jgi:hypothetical protein